MLFLIVLEYAILASTFTLAKIALGYAPPFFLIAIRMLIAGALLTGYAALTGRIDTSRVMRDMTLFLKAGLFHCYLAFIPEFWALTQTTSAKTSLIYALTPFIAALISYVLYAKKLSRMQIGGMMIAFAGLIPLIAFQASPGEMMAFWHISFPELALFGAVASACYAWFVVTELMDRGHSLSLINGVAMGLGGLASVPTFLIVEGAAWNHVTSWLPFAGWLLLLIFTAHVVSYNLYGYLLRKYSITFMTLCGFMCPLFVSVYGALFLGEVLTWHITVALASLALGLFLFVQEGRHKQDLS